MVGCCDWMMESTAVAFWAVAFGEWSGTSTGLGHAHQAGCRSCRGYSDASELARPARWQPGAGTYQPGQGTRPDRIRGGCFVVSPRSGASDPSAFISFPVSSGDILLAVVVALQGVIVTYDGWYGAIYFMEEDRNPTRNLPRSAIGGVVACIAVFLLVNAALLHVLPMPQLAASQVPAADAAMLVLAATANKLSSSFPWSRWLARSTLCSSFLHELFLPWAVMVYFPAGWHRSIPEALPRWPY